VNKNYLNSKFVSNLITVFLVLFPFIRAFSEVFDDTSITDRIQNWTIFLCTLIFLFLYRRSYNKFLCGIYAILLYVYIFNYMFAYISNTAWFLNAIVFLTFSLLFSHIFLNCEIFLINKVESKTNTIIYYISIALILMFFWGCLFIPNYFDFSVDRNNIIAIFTSEFGLYKQTFGYLITLIIIWNFIYWKILNFHRKTIFILLLIVSAPVIMGIRTTILMLILLTILINIGKNYFTLGLTIFSIFITWFNLAYFSEFITFLELFYDRLPSVMFAFDQINSFGLGNGGYHLYVAKYGNELFYKYATGVMLLNGGFWVAPESDLAYFMASFGFLSVVFFLLYLYIIKNGLYAIKFYKTNGYRLLSFVIMYFIALILMGISEDYAGTAGWWVYFSASIGLIVRTKLKMPFVRTH
jgi:hypothetical protein